MNLDLEPIKGIVNQIVTLYRKELQDKGINASSALSNSASAIVDLNGTTLTVSLQLEDYWKYVEYGRGPGKMPPVDKIADWIKIKPVIPNPINGKVPDTKQLAFLIARKIGREGIEARKPLTNIVHSTEFDAVISEVKSEITRQMIEQLKQDELY